MSIFFVVSLAVYSIFSSGVNIWKRSNEIKFSERRIITGLEKFSRDLRNTFKFSNITFEGIRFEGAKGFIAFAAPVDGEIGRVSYFLNNENIFCRKQETYPEYFQSKEQEQYAKLIFQVHEVNLSYCYLDDAATEDYKWKNEWSSESGSIPRAVKIELVVEKEYNQKRKFEKTVFIPVGTGEK